MVSCAIFFIALFGLYFFNIRPPKIHAFESKGSFFVRALVPKYKHPMLSSDCSTRINLKGYFKAFH